MSQPSASTPKGQPTTQVLRRSIRKRKDIVQEIATDSDDNDDRDQTEFEPPSTRLKRYKKRRITTTAVQNNHTYKKYVRGRRGALKELVEMPLDILFEIFGHLNLVDVLHLARTNKALRRILMRESSAFIWKFARVNMGLPECPVDLNEPQYAKIMFDPLCDYCSQANTQIIIWDNFMRCCKNCISDPDKFQVPDFRNPLHHITPKVEVAIKGRNGHHQIKHCCRSNIQLKEEYESLDMSERALWVQNKYKQIRLRLEHGRLCDEWIQLRAMQRASELQTFRLNRYTAIKDKLIGLGWGEEIEKMGEDNLKDHPFVKQPKELTERIWANNGSSLVQFLENAKAERLAHEFRILQKARRDILKDVYYKYVASQPLYAIIPSVTTVAMIPQFRAIVDSPAEEVVTANHFAAASKELPQYAAQWRQSQDTKLVTLVKKYIPGFTESDLTLATTIFRCRFCTKSISYPLILDHECLTTLQYFVTHPDWEMFKDFCESFSDLLTEVSFNEPAHEMASTLLQKNGFNIKTTTTQDLQEPALYFECLCCNSTGRGIFTWNAVINHNPKKADMHLAVLDDEEKRLVETDLAERRNKAYINGGRSWVCLRCKVRFNWPDLHTHLFSHKLGRPPKQDRDYSLHADGHNKSVSSTPVRIKDKAKAPNPS